MAEDKIVVDTNVIYDLGAGVVDIEKLRSKGKICVAPVSILEMVSKLDTSSAFKMVQDGAIAILNAMDEMLIGPEELLASIWNINNGEQYAAWQEGIRNIAQAPDYSAIMLWYEDHDSNVLRRVDTGLAREWKDFQGNGFHREIIEAIDERVPGYGDAIFSGIPQIPRPSKNRKNSKVATQGEFEDFFRSDEMFNTVIDMTRIRAAMGGTFLRRKGKKISLRRPLTRDQATNVARDRLEMYAKFYSRYVYDMIVTSTPEANDFWDLEFFIYVGNNEDGSTTRFATSERSWHRIAREIGASDFVILPEKVTSPA